MKKRKNNMLYAFMVFVLLIGISSLIYFYVDEPFRIICIVPLFFDIVIAFWVIKNKKQLLRRRKYRSPFVNNYTYPKKLKS